MEARIQQKITEIGRTLLVQEPLLGEVWLMLSKNISLEGDIALRYHPLEGFQLAIGPDLLQLSTEALFLLIKQQFIHLALGHWIKILLLPMDRYWIAVLQASGEEWLDMNKQSTPKSLLQWYEQIKRNETTGSIKSISETVKKRYRFWRTSDHQRGQAEAAYLKKYIQQQMTSEAACIGKSSILAFDLFLEELKDNPSMAWRKILRLFTNQTGTTYLRHTHHKISRRYGESPGLRKKRKPRLAILVDTSGSLSRADWRRFFTEIHRIKQNGADIYICEIDVTVRKVWKYHYGIPNQITGGGGTVFDIGLQYAVTEIQPDGIIYFSDGQGPIPEYKEAIPLLWVLTQDREGLPGQAIVMPKLILEANMR